jgi:hypothetical protein
MVKDNKGQVMKFLSNLQWKISHKLFRKARICDHTMYTVCNAMSGQIQSIAIEIESLSNKFDILINSIQPERLNKKTSKDDAIV